MKRNRSSFPFEILFFFCLEMGKKSTYMGKKYKEGSFQSTIEVELQKELGALISSTKTDDMGLDVPYDILEKDPKYKSYLKDIFSHPPGYLDQVAGDDLVKQYIKDNDRFILRKIKLIRCENEFPISFDVIIGNKNAAKSELNSKINALPSLQGRGVAMKLHANSKSTECVILFAENEEINANSILMGLSKKINTQNETEKTFVVENRFDGKKVSETLYVTLKPSTKFNVQNIEAVGADILPNAISTFEANHSDINEHWLKSYPKARPGTMNVVDHIKALLEDVDIPKPLTFVKILAAKYNRSIDEKKATFNYSEFSISIAPSMYPTFGSAAQRTDSINTTFPYRLSLTLKIEYTYTSLLSDNAFSAMALSHDFEAAECKKPQSDGDSDVKEEVNVIELDATQANLYHNYADDVDD